MCPLCIANSSTARYFGEYPIFCSSVSRFINASSIISCCTLRMVSQCIPVISCIALIDILFFRKLLIQFAARFVILVSGYAKGIFSVELLLHSQQRYLCPIQNNDNGIPGYSRMSFNVISKESCIYTFPPHSGHITSLVFLVLLKHTTALSFVGLNDICLASNP